MEETPIKLNSEKKVTPFSLANCNSQTKIYLVLLMILSIAGLISGAIGLFSFSLNQFAVLAIGIVVTGISNLHQPRLPGSKITISAKEVAAFWGIIWLGVSGGIFLSLAASLAAYWCYPKDKTRWGADVFFNIIATSISGYAFYFFLNNVAGFEGNVLANNPLGIVSLISAVAIMGVIHYAINGVLFTAFIKFDSQYQATDSFKNSIISLSMSYAIGLAIFLSLHLAFSYFGLMFGLLMLPLAFAGCWGYRFHYRTLEIKTKEIYESSRIHMATVEALATAIDARDQVGIGHVRRAQIYAVGMGEILGLSEGEIQALTTGALLHDIGKLGVPDHILNKPGRLTPAEMEKMKIHSLVGASILEKINFPYPVIPTVKYHHEMWDGTGYPEGLKKEEIPLTARILSVADAYDTLRGARPYRPAISREEARRYILNGSGSQFDPKLVDIFLRNLRHFEMEVDSEGLAYELDYESPDLFVGEDGGLSEANQGYVEHIKRANREVFALYELARVFSSSLNLQDTLSLFVKKVGELMPFETCAVYLLDKTQEFAKVAYVEGLNAELIRGKQIKVGEGATGYVLKKRQAVYNINPALDFSFYQADSIQDYTAMASLPLIANERLIGAVSLYSCELEIYEDEHMRLLETISRIASDAISKSVYHAETETNALTDPMTNLPNARCLQLHFENEVARANRNGSEFQLIMLDLDGFKAVNDSYGHKAGDTLLREVGKVMRGQLREYDFLARYAGDEFVAIVPDTSNEGIQELCQRLEKAILAFKLPIGDGRFTGVGVSVGSASFPTAGETLDQLIIIADKAMYSVKAQHKMRRNVPTELNLQPNTLEEWREEKPATVTSRVQQINVENIEIDELEIEEISLEAVELNEDAFIVELDETSIISSNTIN